jgi:hypothetical protein
VSGRWSSAMDTKWNEVEHEALRGLSMLAQLIYLKVFRRRMDFITGIAGGPGRVISHQTIMEECGFVPDPGSKKPRWVPTRGEMRAAIEELERSRRGALGPFRLLEEAGSSLHNGYVKKLILALRDESAQKRNNPRNDTKNNPRNDPGSDPIKEPYCDVFKRRVEKGTTQGTTQGTTRGKPEERHSSGVTGVEEEEGLKTLVELALDGSPKRRSGAGQSGEAVRAVFDCWQAVMGHPRAILDAKRAKAVAARLKDGFSVEALCEAVRGCKASEFHQGANDRRTVYDDLTLICRDAAQVEKFIGIAARPRAERSDLDEWLHEDRIIEGVCYGG